MACSLSKSFLGRFYSALSSEGKGMGPLPSPAKDNTGGGQELILPPRLGGRLDPGCVDPLAHHLVLIEEVFRRADDFDVVHFHIDYLHFPVTRRLPVPHVTTLHGRLDIPDLVPLHREYQGMPLASISDAQRAP